MLGHIVRPSVLTRNKQRHNKKDREVSNDRFSSFETPPPSDKELGEFQEFDNTPKCIDNKQKERARSKKQRSYILVEEMPLQFDLNRSLKRANNVDECTVVDSKQNDGVKLCRESHHQASSLKENNSLKYNYLSDAQKQLSMIKEDPREQLRSSTYSSTKPLTNSSRPLLRSTIPAPPAQPKFRYYEDFLETDAHYISMVRQQEQRIMLEEMQIRNTVLQKENISLRERVYLLEFELKRKDEEKYRRESQLIAQRIAETSMEEQALSSRKQTKQKLLQEISHIQSKCKEMRQEMCAFKARQQQQIDKLRRQKQELSLRNEMLLSKGEYNMKFVEVFLNMIQKLPISLENHWTDKKKIAIGWKIIKHLVKKALKLGIGLPTIIEKTGNI